LFEWFCNFKFSLTPNFDQVIANCNSQTSQPLEATVHHHPLEQDLLLARDVIIDLPVVGVERMRDEGG